MRILIATGLYPPDIGGPATYAKILVEELPKHGFGVGVASFSEVRHLPKIIRHISYFFKVLKRGRHADLIYALDPVSVGLPAAIAAGILKKRFMLRLGGDYAWEQGNHRYGINDSPIAFSKRYAEYPFFIKILKRVQKWVANKAEKTIVPSEYLKRVITNWGIDKNKVIMIHNGINRPGPQGRKETLRKLLRFEEKLIISIGRLIPLKGFVTLIQIMPNLLKKYSDLKLLIVGDGPDMPNIRKTVNKLGLENSVILGGSLDQQTLFRYIRASDVFVLNAQHETFSHLLLEVMNIGIPIITTRVGGNPEIIRDGKDGILVRYNNKIELESAILKVLRGKAFSERLVSSAKERVKIFNEHTMIKELILVLRNKLKSY